MAWFFPVSCLLGAVGSRTALQSRHSLRTSRQDRSWWLLVVLAWLPTLCWILAQFVVQD